MHNYEEVIDSVTALTASAAGALAQNNRATGAFIQINVTARSGTSPTLVGKVQWSADGTNWIDLDSTNAASASITAVGQYVIKVYPAIPTVAAGSCNSPLPRLWRMFYTIGGTTPSFDFTTTASYMSTED
jgi:hypothetical protein